MNNEETDPFVAALESKAAELEAEAVEIESGGDVQEEALEEELEQQEEVEEEEEVEDISSIDDLQLDDGLEEEEVEEQEEVDEEESEDDEAASKGPIDPQKIYEEVKAATKGMKAGDLRSEIAAQKAKAMALEVQMSEKADEITAFEKRQEEAEAQRIEQATQSPLIDVKEYPAYQEITEEFATKLKSTQRKLSGDKNRKYLADNADVLLGKMRQLDKMEGDDRDEAEEEMKTFLESKFGEKGADRVFDFMEDAFELDQRASEVREEFDGNVRETSAKAHLEQYENHRKSLKSASEVYYSPDESYKEANPYGMRSFVSALLEGPEKDKMSKMIEKDLSYIAKLTAGEPPFKADDSQWAGMSPEQAKKAYVQQKEKTAAQQALIMPQLLMQGMMAERYFGKIQKRLGELNHKKQKTPLPTKGKTGKRTSKPKSPEAALELARLEQRKALASLG